MSVEECYKVLTTKHQQAIYMCFISYSLYYRVLNFLLPVLF